MFISVLILYLIYSLHQTKMAKLVDIQYSVELSISVYVKGSCSVFLNLWCGFCAA